MVMIQDKNQRVFLDIEFTKIHLHTNNIPDSRKVDQDYDDYI